MREGLGPLEGRGFVAVLFDMDGTLIDSTPAVDRSWATWATEYDVDPTSLGGNHGVPAIGILEQVLPADRQQAALARIIELETADTDGVVLLPGVADALAVLAAGGRSAIATSCTRGLAEARIVASGMTRPTIVVTVDDVEQGKPAPDPWLEAARLLGVDPARCLVVEDAPSGLASARAAGCATLAVTTTTSAEGLLATGNVDAVVSSLADVRFWVEPAPRSGNDDGDVHLEARHR